MRPAQRTPNVPIRVRLSSRDEGEAFAGFRVVGWIMTGLPVIRIRHKSVARFPGPGTWLRAAVGDDSSHDRHDPRTRERERPFRPVTVSCGGTHSEGYVRSRDRERSGPT